MTEQAFETIRYERPAPAVARVVLARAEQRNAQDKRMIYEINDAFDLAVQDDSVQVIILAADGPHFSAGHDLRDTAPLGGHKVVSCWGGFDQPGIEGWMAVEEEIYLGMCWRWRNLPKPTIAQVQGKAIAGGLMLVWACDLIVASDDASFSDPVVAFGVNGHEFFVHAWELGARRAKQFLFTGEALSAQEAHAIGMVATVVAPDDLERATLELAGRIAERPSMGLKLAKQAVNQSLDAQGMWQAVQAAYSLHALGHSHNLQQHGMFVDPRGAAMIRAQAKGSSSS